MEILVAVETVLLAVVLFLVVALLRSHAEVLTRLGLRDAATPTGFKGLAPGIPDPDERQGNTPAHDITGSTLDGGSASYSPSTMGASTLIAFLSSGCSVCQGLWQDLRDERRESLPNAARLLIVVKDPEYESPTKLRELAPPEDPLVMSSAAWEAYEVPGYPYFIYVDGSTGVIESEGAAQRWEQVVSLLRDAVVDMDEVKSRGLAAIRESRRKRFGREDAELIAAGISPDDESLYRS